MTGSDPVAGTDRTAEQDTDRLAEDTDRLAEDTDRLAEQEDDSAAAPMRILVVIEDDPDVQFLVKAIFSMDPRFRVTNVAESAEEALESPPTSEPGIIVLDHGLAGSLPGLAAAPMLKEQAPRAKIILFTAHAALQVRADQEPAIDAFLLKTDSEQLLPLAQELLGLAPS